MNKVENVTFQCSAQNLSQQDIIDFEKSFNIKLPDSFIAHYKTYNGGFPNANWSEGVDLSCPLRYFFSIKYGEDTIEKKAQDLQFKGLLPFAINAIMAYFCIGTDEDNLGQIFYAEKNVKGIYEIELHCTDFHDFISNFYTDNFYGKVFEPKLGWVDNFEAYTKNW